MVLTREGRCPDHRERWERKGATRTSSEKHRKWAAIVKKRDPYCRVRLPGCTHITTQADHIVPVAFGGAEFDPANGQGICTSCHRKKSSREGHLGKGVAR